MGIVGLIWANVINMAVRGLLSLKISLSSLGDDVGLFKIFKKVLLHKFFLALATLGVIGTAIAQKALFLLNTKLYPNYITHYEQVKSQL